MNEEDPNFILNLLFGIIERSIEKTIRILKKEKGEDSLFSLELFKLIVKVETYNLFTSDLFLEEVQEIIQNLRIDYNIYNKKKERSDLYDYNQESEDGEYQGDDEYSGEEHYEDEEFLEEDDEEEEEEEEPIIGNENISMLLDFPLSDIVEIINLELDDNDTETIDLTKDLNIIESIWEEWRPENSYGEIFKGMIDHFINSIKFS